MNYLLIAVIFLASSGYAVEPSHDVTPTTKVNERPIAGNEAMPFIPIQDATLVDSIQPTVDRYSSLYRSFSGVDELGFVPAGSPPYPL